MNQLTFQGTEKEVENVNNAFSKELNLIKQHFKEQSETLKEVEEAVQSCLITQDTNASHPEITFSAFIKKDCKNRLVGYLLFRMVEQLVINKIGKERITYQ